MFADRLKDYNLALATVLQSVNSFELVGVGKAQMDPSTGRFTKVNRKLCEMSGYTQEELLKMTESDLTHPDDRERDAALDWLERAYADHESPLLRMDVVWDWLDLHNDPRFQTLRRRVGLP